MASSLPVGPLPATLRDHGGMEFEVREYGPSDRVALGKFYEEFEPKRAAQGLPPKDPERISRWLDSILVQGRHLLTLREGEVIGHALLVPTGEEGILEYAIFLRSDLRGRGLGTEVNRAAIALARDAGFAGLWLTVEPHNRAALRSYEKAGFSLVPGTIFSSEAEMRLTL